jgi:hypothetical protein
MSLRSAAELAQDPDLMRPPETVAPPCGVAGRVTLLALGPKKGKSTTVAGIVRDASQAGVKCALLTLDEALADSLQRLERFGADLENVYLDDDFHPETLMEEIATLDIGVLALDHLGKLAERNADFGANSQGDPVLWGRLVAPFATLARETNVAVILLDQARRSDGDWTGSVGKGGNVDLIAVLHAKDAGLACSPIGRTYLPPFRVDLNDQGHPVFSSTDSGGPESRATVVTDANRRALLQLLDDAEPDGLETAEWARLAKDAHHLSRASFYRIRKEHIQAGRLLYASKKYRVAGDGAKYLRSVSAVPEVSVIPLEQLKQSQLNGIRSAKHKVGRL